MPRIHYRAPMIVAVLGIVCAVTACTGPSHMTPVGRPATSTPTGPVLQSVVNTASGSWSYQLPVSTSDRVGHGAEVVINTGPTPIRLLRMTPMFGGDHTGLARVLGTGVARLTSADPSDLGVGITRSFPQTVDPALVFHGITGVTLEPYRLHQYRYELMVGLQVDYGTVVVTGLSVTFVDGTGTQRVERLPGQLLLCTGRPAGASTCR